MKSNAIRKAAEGETCTFQIAGVCNYNNETTVLCHLPSETSGKGLKSTDLCAAFGCSSCHDAIDDRAHSDEYQDHKYFYNLRALVRTTTRLWEMGIISIKGAK